MEIHDVLHEIQQNLKAPKNQTNSFGGYRYRSCEDILEAVKPLLPEGHYVCLSDEMVEVGSRLYVKAKAYLHGPSADVSTTAYAREAETKKGMDVSQITGAASSYARKYALNGLFCIDDTKDADSQEPPNGKKEPTKPEPPPTTTIPAESATKAQTGKLFKLGEGQGLTKDEIIELCRWYRKGDKLLKSEASELIKNFKEATSHWREEQMAGE